ncbi:MAG: hypothetical protein L0Z50_36785, partial [Verrucomicrobiales bacterium]|nr:hypothetical protein [Verrucomicrobiales bacterium]
MASPPQFAWTRLSTATGRFEYQFQGRTPAVRGGEYLEAHDYQFLILDEEGWLYRIPVRLDAAAEIFLKETLEPRRAAEVQLRAGLETYRPRKDAPYSELDSCFAVDSARARELLA